MDKALKILYIPAGFSKYGESIMNIEEIKQSCLNLSKINNLHDIKELISEKSDDPFFKLALGLGLIEDENTYKDAEKIFDELFVQLFDTQAIAFEDLWMYEDINRVCRQILNLDPNNFTALFRLAMSNGEQGNLRWSIFYCKKALAINSNDDDTWFLLGRDYVYAGKSKEARKILEIMKKKGLSLADTLASLIEESSHWPMGSGQS